LRRGGASGSPAAGSADAAEGEADAGVPADGKTEVTRSGKLANTEKS
jgi:hypothetical protein